MNQMHRNENDLVSWRSKTSAYIKGFLQPSRCFGDFYLKFRKEELPPNILIPRYMDRKIVTPPYITAEPEVILYVPQKSDRFIIVGSDGIWELLNERDVAEISRSAPTPQECI